MAKIKITNNIDKALKVMIAKQSKAAKQVGLFVEGKAKKLSPVDKGRLRQSIENDTDEGKATIGTNVKYAIFVEKGTKFQKPQPYLTPAAENNVEAIKKIIADVYGEIDNE